MTDEKEKDWYNSMDANELIIFWVATSNTKLDISL